MDYSEIILTVGCVVPFVLFLFVIDEGYKQIRAEEEKFKAQKEKVFRLRNTSYRRGVR
ncbi:hypothetical protein NLU03_24915 [Bacillus toyonensis]|nr:hypothetical protein [Bacillus toyonensis]